MTTAVYDGKNLAADTGCVWGERRLQVASRKINPVLTSTGRRFLVANCGIAGEAPLLLRNFVKGTLGLGDGEINRYKLTPIEGPLTESSLIVIELLKSSHRAFLIGAGGTGPEITGHSWAIGSGLEYAMGALDQGASAMNAVRTAQKYDPFTFGGVTNEVINNWVAQTNPDVYFKLEPHK